MSADGSLLPYDTFMYSDFTCKRPFYDYFAFMQK